MSKDFKAIDHGKGKIDLSHLGKANRMKPVEIHHKEDGSITDEPSFAIVMVGLGRVPAFGEITLKMLNEGLNEIGYEIIKKQL